MRKGRRVIGQKVAGRSVSDAQGDNRDQLSPHLIHDFRRPPPSMADPIDTTPGATLEKVAYDPKPSLQYASAVGLQAAGIGALVSAVQNALGTHTSGAAGFLTRTGGTIGFFGACWVDLAWMGYFMWSCFS